MQNLPQGTPLPGRPGVLVAGAPSQNWDKAALSRLPKSTHVSEILIVGCVRAPK
jgi:hypothetical protein